MPEPGGGSLHLERHPQIYIGAVLNHLTRCLTDNKVVPEPAVSVAGPPLAFDPGCDVCSNCGQGHGAAHPDPRLAQHEVPRSILPILPRSGSPSLGRRGQEIVARRVACERGSRTWRLPLMRSGT